MSSVEVCAVACEDGSVWLESVAPEAQNDVARAIRIPLGIGGYIFGLYGVIWGYMGLYRVWGLGFRV